MNHLKQIAAKLDDYGLDAMMITSEPGEFYAVGLHGEGIVLVTRNETTYITDSRYVEMAEKVVTDATVRMVDREHGYVALVNEFLDRLGIARLGIEETYMTLAAHQRYSENLHAQLIPAGKLLLELRAAKDDQEIECMIHAQRVAERAFDEILGFLKPGVTEREAAAKLTYDMLRFGGEKNSFDPIVVSGLNGSLPHGIPGDRAIQPGDFVTMDFGCKWGGYCSDMTRTVAVGQPTQEMVTVYELVLNAQKAGIAASQAGVRGKDIDAAARSVIEAGGYGAYFGHGYGHSLGLEIHESPNANSRDDTPMPVGAVVSAEPGIYLPDRFGVRIEDVVIMEKGGCRDITLAPKELIIL